MLLCVLSFGRKIVVFVIAIQRYLCNSTFCKSLLSCGDAVVLLVAGKRWLSQPDQESKRSYWEEPCHILVSFFMSIASLQHSDKLFMSICFTTAVQHSKELVMNSSWDVVFNNLILEGI